MKTLLIVENNIDFAYVVEWHFQQKGMKVLTTTNGQDALALHKTHLPDIILLDINIDGETDGKDVARKIRTTDKYTPIIFMSGESKSPADVVEGFDIGCSFFLKKPVAVEEIEAHINVALNTKTTQASHNLLGIVFDMENRTLSFEGKVEYLSEKESKVLQILADSPNTIIEYQTFLNAIWKGELAEESLRNNISSLRKKITDTALKIETIKNKGYRLNVPD